MFLTILLPPSHLQNTERIQMLDVNHNRRSRYTRITSTAPSTYNKILQVITNRSESVLSNPTANAHLSRARRTPCRHCRSEAARLWACFLIPGFRPQHATLPVLCSEGFPRSFFRARSQKAMNKRAYTCRYELKDFQGPL